MKITRRAFLISAAALPLARFVSAAPYEGTAKAVEVWRAEWHDAKRDRAVPVKIYYPKDIAAPCPVIVFSHGLGGSREGYEYLGNYWASRGYVSVHLQHLGSDSAVWQGGDLQALKQAANAKNALDRARDVSFALDQLEILNKTADFPLQGKLDLQRIGMAGHSFGANTALLVSGMNLGFPGAPSLTEPRIKAAVILSAPSPMSKNYDVIYGSIRLPMLHMTGTKDTSPIDRPGSTAADRRLPFDHIHGSDAYLLTFKDGDHMVFSGQRRGASVATDDRYHALIQQSSTAFWDTYLQGDAKGKQWLKSDFRRELGENGVFEGYEVQVGIGKVPSRSAHSI